MQLPSGHIFRPEYALYLLFAWMDGQCHIAGSSKMVISLWLCFLNNGYTENNRAELVWEENTNCVAYAFGLIGIQ